MCGECKVYIARFCDVSFADLALPIPADALEALPGESHADRLCKIGVDPRMYLRMPGVGWEQGRMMAPGDVDHAPAIDKTDDMHRAHLAPENALPAHRLEGGHAGFINAYAEAADQSHTEHEHREDHGKNDQQFRFAARSSQIQGIAGRDGRREQQQPQGMGICRP